MNIAPNASGVEIEFFAIPEVIVPVFHALATKRTNITTFDLAPTRMLKTDDGLVATDMVVRQQSVVSPLAQALEAHVRHHAGQALREYQKSWNEPWDYDGQYAVEILIGELPRGSHDTDNLAKSLLDGLQGAGGLFSSDAKVQVVKIDRGGSKRRGFKDKRHGFMVPTVVRIIPSAIYHDLNSPKSPYVAGVVFPSRWSDYSLTKELGLPVFSSREQVSKTVAKGVTNSRKSRKKT